MHTYYRPVPKRTWTFGPYFQFSFLHFSLIFFTLKNSKQENENVPIRIKLKRISTYNITRVSYNTIESKSLIPFNNARTRMDQCRSHLYRIHFRESFTAIVTNLRRFFSWRVKRWLRQKGRRKLYLSSGGHHWHRTCFADVKNTFRSRERITLTACPIRHTFSPVSFVSLLSSLPRFFFFFLPATKQPSGQSSFVLSVESLMAKLVVIRARGLNAKRPARTTLELGRARLNFHPV